MSSRHLQLSAPKESLFILLANQILIDVRFRKMMQESNVWYFSYYSNTTSCSNAGLIYPGNSGQDPQVADAWCRPLTVYKKKNGFRSFSKRQKCSFCEFQSDLIMITMSLKRPKIGLAVETVRYCQRKERCYFPRSLTVDPSWLKMYHQHETVGNCFIAGT